MPSRDQTPIWTPRFLISVCMIFNCQQPSRANQSVPIVGKSHVSAFCVCRETTARRTPPCGSRVRVAAQLGHSTSATLLSRKRLKSMETTTPENVHLVEAAGCDAAFFRDRT